MNEATLAVGTRLGPYEILALVGRGGMGEVYRARDSALDRDVALKVLSPHALDDPTFAERFRREAQIWGRLEHPCIVPVYFAGIEEGRPFLAMKFVSGGSLADVLCQGRLLLERATAILADVATALDYAHSLGFVHRDVKPANVLLGDDGRALLSDFGIARAIVQEATPTTHTGGVVGTPGYMAPEQALRQQPDTRSDLYSLGCTAYEMLTGSPPFRGETPLDVLMRQVNEPPTPPRAVSPDVSAHVERALLKALSKEPAGRWPSATLFVEALRGRVDVSHVQTISLAGRLATIAVTTPRPPPAEAGSPEPAPPRRSRLSLRRLAVLILLGTTLGAAAFFGLQRYAASLEATPSSPRPPAPETLDLLLVSARRALDEGDYPGALRFAELAVRLKPDAPGARALAERARKAWEAEKILGLWEPSPSPSP